MRFRLLLILLAAPWLVRGATHLPAASNLVARVVTRAKEVAHDTQTNHYTYDKRSLVSELDEKGAVTQTTEKLYRVVLIGGLSFPKLVKLQGRDLSPKELEKETQREIAFRQRLTRVDVKKKSRRKEGLATQELVDRFDFQVTKRELIADRPTLVVTFVPRPGGADDSMEDKIYRQVTGTIWVDEDEAEITKLDARVKGPVPLGWFGAAGSLNQFHATFERLRLPDGVWVNRKSVFTVMARKLFTALRSRTTEESSGFRRE